MSQSLLCDDSTSSFIVLIVSGSYEQLLSDQLLVCALSSNFEWPVSGNKTIQVGKLSMADLGHERLLQENLQNSISIHIRHECRSLSVYSCALYI